ncbi:ATP-binding protein [Streptomyces sp. NPDC059697]|uniref:ATP-binding protein n=1 Tax=Streptomyces sp. NPDC059697 TaxID=3346912 RepID=UPI00369A0A8B
MTQPLSEGPAARGHRPGIPSGDRTRLAVRDSDSDPPVPVAYSLTAEGSARAEHGRGLYLGDALAHTWNTSPSGWGKTVWLEMDIPEAERRTVE